jgi:hypothetical protein
MHRGQILEKAIRKSQIPITKVAERFGKSQRHLYNLFEKENISNEDMAAFGKLIGYDFSKEIPELVEYFTIHEPQELYLTASQYRDKYYALLEEHISLIRELEKIKNSAPSEPGASKVRQKKKPK